jgi:hypothetical protein
MTGIVPEALLWDDVKPQKYFNRLKRKDIPKKLTYDEWIARERAFHDCLWAVSRLYEPIPPDTIFIAQDKHGRNILAVFPNGLKVANGQEEAERYITNPTQSTGICLIAASSGH